ncbi:MAG: MFS transporter [Planctomycetota bacterium]|jgi:MFS family permease|nr:MFS transporter [Planctomycetota bacterium]
MLGKLRINSTLWVLTFGHAMADLYICILAAVAPGLSLFLDIPLGDLVILIGLGAVACNLASPISGWIMLRHNLAWILWFAIPLSALPAGMGFAPGYWPLAFMIVAGGFGTGLFHPEGALAANDASGEEAYLGVPFFMAGGAGGYAIGTLASIWISESLGFPALWIWIIPGLVSTALLIDQYRRRKRAHPSIVIRPRSKRITPVNGKNLPFWLIFAMSSLFCLGNGIYINLMTSHFEIRFGPGARTMAGWILLLTSLNGALASLVWSSLTNKYGFFRITLATQLLAFPLFIAMAYPVSPWLGLAAALPLSLLAPTSVYPLTIALARNASGLTQATRTALVMGGAGLVSALGVIAAGMLVRTGFSTGLLFLSAAGCSLAAALIAAGRIFRERRKNAAGFVLD